MNFRSIFGRSRTARRFQARRNVSRNGVAEARTERLETRAMLAGNVTAQLVGTTAFINGDAADNSVEVIVDAGNVIARGIDGTTINGSTDDFVLVANSTTLAGSLVSRLSSGNDTLAISGITIDRDVHVHGGNGNDTVTIQDSSIARSVWMTGGRGDDLMATSSVTIGGNLRISGGVGNDDIVVDASTINRDTRLTGWRGDDDIAIRNSTLGDDLVISTHAGNDIIMIDGGTVADRAWLFTGRGADNIAIQGGAQFSGRVRAFGGIGGDNLQTSSDVSFGRLRFRNFESGVIEQSILDTRITDATTGAIGLAEAAVAAANPSITVTVAQSDVDETDGTITDGITVTRSGSTTEELVVTLTSDNTDKLTVPATVTIPVGADSVTADLTIIDTAVAEGDTVVTITATATNLNTGTVDVTITEDDALTLTSNVGSPFELSNGVEVTKSENVLLTGLTAPNAVVTIDRDADGLFDDGTATADASGNYSITTTLLNNTTNRGANNLVLRATLGSGSSAVTQDVTKPLHYATGSVVRFELNQDLDNDGTLDFFDAELFDGQSSATAPSGTVSNFLSYTTDTATGVERYDNLVLQRSDRGSLGTGFIVQAGRYNINGSQITEIDRDADNDGTTDTIPGEFNAINSNVRGTLSMALPGSSTSSTGTNVDGGSSEWFINTVDNLALDPREHTVFGQVIGTGMDVVDALHAVPTGPAGSTTYDLDDLYAQTSLGFNALANVPLLNAPPTGTALTGSVSLTLDSPTLTGTGTSFTTELTAGTSVQLSGRIFFIDSIQSDTEATLTESAPFGIGSSTATADVTPDPDDFLVFTNIGEILDNV